VAKIKTSKMVLRPRPVLRTTSLRSSVKEPKAYEPRSFDNLKWEIMFIQVYESLKYSLALIFLRGVPNCPATPPDEH